MPIARLKVIALVVATTVVGNLVAHAEYSARIDAQADELPAPAELIDVFDRGVQKRFHDVLGFGMARIATDRKFVPDTEEEKAAVKAFKKAKVTVALFLVGRLALEPTPERDRFEAYDFFKRAIGNPLFVRVNTNSRPLPYRWELLRYAGEALTMFSRGKDSFESTVGEWNVRARPVRASDQECLRCHKEDYRVVYPPPGGATTELTGNKIQVGDPIGALFYLYLRSQSK